MYKPVGERTLIEVIEKNEEETTSSGIIIPDSSQQNSSNTEGMVISSKQWKKGAKLLFVSFPQDIIKKDKDKTIYIIENSQVLAEIT